MSDIKPIKVSLVFDTEEYLECCESDDLEPTQEGFEDFIIESYFEDWFDPNDLTIERIGD